MDITTLDAASEGFEEALDDLLSWSEDDNSSVLESVTEIINDVRKRGDEALFSYTEQFDQWSVSADDVVIASTQLEQAWNELPTEQATALTTAAERIRTYAEHQKQQSWSFSDKFGNTLGQKVTPIQRVGV